MGERRQSRELALQCLFQWDQQGPDGGRDLAAAFLSRAGSDAIRLYAKTLLDAYWDDAAAIDERLAVAVENWSVQRMAVVDRCILRLAVAELTHVRSVPPRVILDEAIELAKRYSTEKSGAFVNGILDRILKGLERAHGT